MVACFDCGLDSFFITCMMFALDGVLRAPLKIGGIMAMVACFDCGFNSLFITCMMFALDGVLRAPLKVGGVGCSYNYQFRAKARALGLVYHNPLGPIRSRLP